MTSTPDRESSTPDREAPATSDPGTICPYLLVAAGRWRNAEPSREHVCAAQAEVVPIGLETQRRLCFGDHAACGRYQDALEAYRTAVPLVPLRPVARTTPVVVDRGRAPLPMPHLGDRRTLGQAILALAMVAAGRGRPGRPARTVRRSRRSDGQPGGRRARRSPRRQSDSTRSPTPSPTPTVRRPRRRPRATRRSRAEARSRRRARPTRSSPATRSRRSRPSSGRRSRRS